MSAKLHFEDLAPGRKFESGTLTVTADMIRRFAGDFDPQPFHLDADAARGTLFGELVASGWHTAALTMRLIVESLPFAGGVIGAGAEVAWPKPLRAGETIRLDIEILELRASKSKPHLGFAKTRVTTLAADGSAVQTMTANLVVPRRDPAAGA
jgi:acyl dehydratase